MKTTLKKIAIMAAVAAGILTFKTADAQIGLHVNLNLGPVAVHAVLAQPAPVQYADYDNSDDYFYLPDVDAYYSVTQNCYYYMDDNRWISAAYLPGRYHDFDWRTARRYEVRESRPYLHNDVYRAKFSGNAQRGNWGYAENRNDNRGGFNHTRGGFDQQRDNNHNGYNQPSNNYSQPRNNDQRDQNHENNGQQHDNGKQSRGNNNGGQNNSQPSNQPTRDRGDNNNRFAANQSGVRPTSF